MGRVKKSKLILRESASQARGHRSYLKKVEPIAPSCNNEDKENKGPINESIVPEKRIGGTICDASTMTEDTAPRKDILVIYQSRISHEIDNKCQQTDDLIVPRKKSKPTSSNSEVSGRRIVSMASMVDAVNMSSLHSSMCPKGPVKYENETKAGLACRVYFACGCGKKFEVNSNQNTILPANESLVWGNTQSSVGYNSSRALLTTLEITPPSFPFYKKLQDTFYSDMEQAMQIELSHCAKRESELAVENGDFVVIDGERYPAITVILDGGWGKRSYRHSFSSEYGVAVIIGARTGKVIFMNTRISSCHVCSTDKLSQAKKNHICHKNWSGPPNGMESDILLEGFSRSLKDHRIVYKEFIGDGDSSVYSKIINVYPGFTVQKVECVNHVCKNFTTRLMDISMNTVRGKDAPKIPIEDRRIFNPKIPRFKAGLKQAINHHSSTGSDWKALYEDILNMPNHIFGDHAKCKSYFCTGPKEKERNVVPHVSKMEFWKPLMAALDRPASLAPSLVKKKTSNAAESFMSVCCKFLEGKRKYFGQGYLYKLRMSAAVFSYNECSFWVGKALELIKKQDPSSKWNASFKISTKVKQRKGKYYVKRPLKIPQLAPSNFDYGDNPLRPDLPDDVIAQKINDLFKSLQVSDEKKTEIEQITKKQAESLDWKLEREVRITASQAGAIFKLGDSTDNQSVLDAHFGRNIWASAQVAMNYGKQSEKTAIAAYEKHKDFTPGYVREVGLVVYSKNGILGASPDGLVGDVGLLEVKCPYVLFTKDKEKKGPSVWPFLSRASSLHYDSGTLCLKKSHHHYYQVIMQLYVTEREWVDYFVWSPHGVFCERISRSKETDKLWSKMLIKMERFWREDLAPELVDSRFDRAWSKYRCSSARQVGRDKKEAAKQKRKRKSTEI